MIRNSLREIICDLARLGKSIKLEERVNLHKVDRTWMLCTMADLKELPPLFNTSAHGIWERSAKKQKYYGNIA